MKSLADVRNLLDTSYEELVHTLASNSSEYIVHSPTVTQTSTLVEGSNTQRRLTEYMNLEYIIEVPTEDIAEVKSALQSQFRDEMEYLATKNGIEILSITVESRTGIRNFSFSWFAALLLVGAIIVLVGIIWKICTSYCAGHSCVNCVPMKVDAVEEVKRKPPSLRKGCESDILILHPPNKGHALLDDLSPLLITGEAGGLLPHHLVLLIILTDPHLSHTPLVTPSPDQAIHLSLAARLFPVESGSLLVDGGHLRHLPTSATSFHVHRVGGQLLPVVRFNIRLPSRPSACIGSQFCLRSGTLTLRVGLEHLDARSPYSLGWRHRWLWCWSSHRPLVASVPLVIQLFPVVCSDHPLAGLCRLPVARGNSSVESGLTLTLLVALVHHIVQELISLPLHTLGARLVICQLALRHRILGLPPRGRLQLAGLLSS